MGQLLMCPSDGMVAPTMCSSPQNWFQKQENEISQQPQKFQKQCGISQTLTKAARKNTRSYTVPMYTTALPIGVSLSYFNQGEIISTASSMEVS